MFILTFLHTFPQMFISKSLALVVFAREVEVIVIVGVVVAVIAVQAMSAVKLVAHKYCFYSHLITSLIIS